MNVVPSTDGTDGTDGADGTDGTDGADCAAPVAGAAIRREATAKETKRDLKIAMAGVRVVRPVMK